MGNLLNDLLGEAGNEFGSIAEDGIIAGDVSGYISTGSGSLDALLSGSLYDGGIAVPKVTALAGEPSTGKTFYAISIINQFLKKHPKGFVFCFLSESDISKKTLADRGVDTSRVGILPVATVQEFRTQAVRILDKYMEQDEKKRPPMFFVLDSLGNLSTDKEVEDITAGKDTRDMTRAQLIRGAFRVITLKLGIAQVAMLITNHVYDVIGSYFPMKKMGGGSGLDYAASTVVFLSKAKEKDNDEIIGAKITARLVKSRLTRENKKVETLLRYDSGLDPYYGLTDLAVKFGIFKKISKKILLPNGKDAFEIDIIREPSKYFDAEILKQIDEGCKNEFLYGTTNHTKDEEDDNGDTGKHTSKKA